jgi:hypothetical protein
MALQKKVPQWSIWDEAIISFYFFCIFPFTVTWNASIVGIKHTNKMNPVSILFCNDNKLP